VIRRRRTLPRVARGEGPPGLPPENVVQFKVSGNVSAGGRIMSRKMTIVALLGCLGQAGGAALASGKNVAVIDSGAVFPGTEAQAWCQLLIDHGHTCTPFPKQGPTGPLAPFDAVIDLSYDWADPTGTLADFMRAGKTVIIQGGAPNKLGVDTDATVQAWIGANGYISPSNRLITTALDPILGNTPVGTTVASCADGPCAALTDASGHPFAKVLARFTDWPNNPPIGIMRNFWEGGVSVYLTNVISPVWTPSTNWIILNAVEARNTIPTLHGWGLLALALGIGAAGTIVLRGRRLMTRSCQTGIAVLVASLAAAGGALSVSHRKSIAVPSAECWRRFVRRR
jgi:hypothetical protein